MKLSEQDAQARLSSHDHGVLATLHPERGVDAVPVVYAFDHGFIAVPIDQVKPKSSSKLQRERNLAADPRATLLIDHWDPIDWSQLWWVRAQLVFQVEPATSRADRLAARLAKTFVQYRDQPFHRLLVFRVERVTGWAASTS